MKGGEMPAKKPKRRTAIKMDDVGKAGTYDDLVQEFGLVQGFVSAGVRDIQTRAETAEAEVARLTKLKDTYLDALERTIGLLQTAAEALKGR
jgi:hypothetical protein